VINSNAKMLIIVSLIIMKPALKKSEKDVLLILSINGNSLR